MKHTVNKFLLLFRFCHFKYYSNGSYSDSFYAPIGLLRDSLTASLENIKSVNVSSTSGERFHLYFKHYFQCFLHCYLVDQVEDFLHDVMNRLEWTPENPDYFLLLEDKPLNTETTDILTVHKRQFYTGLLRNKPNVYPVVIISGLSEIFLICHSCRDVFHFLNAKDYTSIENLQKYWYLLHGNLNQVPIENNYWHRNEKAHEQCEKFASFASSIRWGFMGKELCMHAILRENLNYSTDTYHILSTVHGRANIMSLERKAWSSKHQSSEWLPYDVEYASFYYTTILRRPRSQPSYFVEPFDFSTWFAIVFCYITYCLASFGMVNSSMQLNLQKVPISDVAIQVVGSLLDQSVSKQLGLMQRLDWATWIISAAVLGQFYKGVVYSFLAKPSNPDWPTRISDLADVSRNYTLLTASFRVPELLTSEIETRNSSDSTKLVTAFQNIYKRIQRLALHWAWVAFPSVWKEFMKQYNYPVQLYNNEIPEENVVVIDRPILTHLISTGCNEFRSTEEASVPTRFSLLDEWRLWNVRRTYFSPIFTIHLSLLVESGISEKISRHTEIFEKRRMLMDLNPIIQIYAADHRFRKTANMSIRQASFLAQLQGSASQMRKNSNLAFPLTLKVLMVLFVMYVVALSIILLVFAMEIVATS